MYFSEDSVWAMAIEDTWRYLHRKFKRDDHITFEKDLIHMKKFWKQCTGRNINRNDCQKEIFERIRIYMKDFQWSGIFPQFEQRNYAAVRVSYQAMVQLMLKVLAEEPLINKEKEMKEWYEAIKSELTDTTKYFADFQLRIENENPYDISPIEVCVINQALWQEFDQPGCEERSKPDKEVDEGKDKTKMKQKRSFDDIFLPGERFYVIDDKDNDDEDVGDENEKDAKFYETFTPDVQKIERIGGITSDFVTIISAKFTDYGGNKVISTGQRTADVFNSPKSVNVEKLLVASNKKREEYIRNTSKQFNTYIKQTFGKVKRAAEIFSKQLQRFIVKYKSSTSRI